MPDGETTTPAPRRRPVYGRPAPASSGPASGPDASGHGTAAPGGAAYGGSAHGDPSYGSYGGPAQGDAAQHGAAAQSGPAAHHGGSPQAPAFHNAFGSPAPGSPSGPFADGPATGPLPQQPPRQPTGSAPSRRRGLWPLLIGLALLVIIAPAATIGGLVWSFSSLVGDASTGPTVIEGGTGEFEVGKNQMLILYVPAEDAAGAQCTAEGTSSGAVSQFPTSGSVTFGDGSSYEQVLGVAATEDTTVTISCTGTEAPAYLGPYSLLGIAAPMLIGPITGIVAGLIGLILTIIGIVRLVRSRRA